jgi:hypothetical protein
VGEMTAVTQRGGTVRIRSRILRAWTIRRDEGDRARGEMARVSCLSWAKGIVVMGQAELECAFTASPQILLPVFAAPSSTSTMPTTYSINVRS